MPHPKKSKNQVHLENGTFEQIVTHLEREIKLIGLEALDELHEKIVSQYVTKKSKKPNPTCHHMQKTKSFQTPMPSPEETRKQAADTKNSSGNNKSAPTNSISYTKNNNHKHNQKNDKNLHPSTHPVTHVEKRIIPQNLAVLEPLLQTGHFSEKANQKHRLDLKNRTHRTL